MARDVTIAVAKRRRSKREANAAAKERVQRSLFDDLSLSIDPWALPPRPVAPPVKRKRRRRPRKPRVLK